MEQFLANLQYDQIGFAGLVGFGILAIMRGWIVPRSVLVDLRNLLNARIAEVIEERDDWKTAYFKSEEARHVLASQNGELLALAKVSAHVLESLPRVESDKNGVA